MEHILASQIMKHLEDNNILYQIVSSDSGPNIAVNLNNYSSP